MRRWSLPILAALTASAILAGCSKMDTKKLTLHGVSYEFPKEDVEGIVHDQGHTFVRIRPSNQEFQLILNTRSDRRQRETDALVISGVSDQLGTFEDVQTPVGTVLCKDVPHWGCGFEVFDQGIRWSVIFDRDHIDEVERFKATASSLLQSYRS